MSKQTSVIWQEDYLGNRQINWLFLIAALSHFFICQISSYSNVYFSSLFLMHYPAKWLVYLNIVSSPLNIILIYVATIFFRVTHFRSVFLTVVLVVIMASTIFFLHMPYSWIPFAICAYAMTFKSLVVFMAVNIEVCAFNTQQYKSYINIFYVLGSIGSIVAGFFSSFIVQRYSQTYLLYLIIVFSMALIGCLIFLYPRYRDIEQKSKQTKISLLRYPLVSTLIIIIFLGIISYDILEYTMNFTLSQTLQKDQIAYFFGIFFGICDTILLLVQLFVIKPVLKNFGLKWLFYITPTIMLFLSFLFLFHPSLPTAVIAVGFFCAMDACDAIGSSITYSVLSQKIREAARAFSRIADKAGKIVAGGLITLFSSNFFSKTIGLQLLCVSTIVCYVIWLIKVRKIDTAYTSALKEGVKSKHFDTVNILEDQKSISSKLIIDLLQDDDSTLNLFGFTSLNILVTKEKEGATNPQIVSRLPNVISSSISQILEKKLDSNDYRVKIESIKFIKIVAIKSFIPKLLLMLQQEQHSDVICEALLAINDMGETQQITTITKFWLDSSDHYQKLYGVLAALLTTNSPFSTKAREILNYYFAHKDQNVRWFSVKIAKLAKVSLAEDNITQILNDQDIRVIIEGFSIVEQQAAIKLLPLVASKLANSDVSSYAIKTLQKFALQSLPHVLVMIKKLKPNSIDACVRALLTITEGKLTQDIIDLTKANNVLLRNSVAKNMLLYIKTICRDKDFMRTTNNIIVATIDEIKKLQLAKMIINQGQKGQKFDNQEDVSWLNAQYIHYEIKAKLYLAIRRLVNWLALYVGSVEIANISYTIAHPSEAYAIRRSKAIELIENLITEKELCRTIIPLLTEENHYQKIAAKDRITYLEECDPVVKTFIHYARNSNGRENMEETIKQYETFKKVVTLRQVSLFEELPSEILYTIAEEAQWREVTKGDILFSQGDEPDGLYIIASGKIKMKHTATQLAILKEHDFFGELGLIDNSPRTADAIVEEDGMLLCFDKITFDNIIGDLRCVLLAVVNQVIKYTRLNLQLAEKV